MLITASAPYSAIPFRSAVGIESVGEMCTPMSATIIPESLRMRIIEVVHCVVAIDRIMPGPTQPLQRMKEIIHGREDAELPVQQDMAQVCIPISQIRAIDLIRCLHAEEIVQVDLVAVVILLTVQVQLIRHLVGKIKSLVACLFVWHTHNGH